MSVACAWSRECQASSPRPRGSLFALGASTRSEMLGCEATCICKYPMVFSLQVQIYQHGQERTSMSSQLHPDLDQSLSGQFAAVADGDRVTRTAAALEGNGISVLRAANAGEAKRIVLGLIPAGAHVHQGASQTLDVSGITEEIE